MGYRLLWVCSFGNGLPTISRCRQARPLVGLVFFILDSAVFLFDYFNVQRLIFIWGLLHTFRFQNSKPFPPTAGTFRKKVPFIRTRSLRWNSVLEYPINIDHPKQNSIEMLFFIFWCCNRHRKTNVLLSRQMYQQRILRNRSMCRRVVLLSQRVLIGCKALCNVAEGNSPLWKINC